MNVYSVNFLVYNFTIMSEYHHGNLKEKLLTEGLKLLGKEGYNSFSLRKLARICKVSHTSPYRHFADKNELVLAIAARIQIKFNEALKDALNNTEGSQKEKVKAMGKRYVSFFLENPDYLEVLFLTPEIQALSSNNHNHCEGSSFKTYMSAVIPLFKDKNDGLIPANPTSALDNRIPGKYLRAWCLIHGLTVLLVKKAVPVTDKKEIDMLVGEVLSGVFPE